MPSPNGGKPPRRPVSVLCTNITPSAQSSLTVPSTTPHPADRRRRRASPGTSPQRLPRPLPPVAVVLAPPPAGMAPSSLDPVDFDGKTWLLRDVSAPCLRRIVLSHTVCCCRLVLAKPPHHPTPPSMRTQYVWLALALGLSPQGYMLGTLGLGLGLRWEWCLLAALGASVLGALLASATCALGLGLGRPTAPLGHRLPTTTTTNPRQPFLTTQ